LDPEIEGMITEHNSKAWLAEQMGSQISNWWLLAIFFWLINTASTWWNSKNLELNNYFDEVICQTNFKLSRRVRKSANPVYQVISGIPD
jgi:hypothetical protein